MLRHKFKWITKICFFIFSIFWQNWK